jgi:hypothetical protein
MSIQSSGAKDYMSICPEGILTTPLDFCFLFAYNSIMFAGHSGTDWKNGVPKRIRPELNL